jgi:CubicO group peptidase (beta-lactamase class C family)
MRGALAGVAFAALILADRAGPAAGQDESPAPAPPLEEPVIATGSPGEVLRSREASRYSHRHGGLCLLILKEGEIVFEQHAWGSHPDRAYQIASGTKSFWGPAAAAAVEEGLFTLDEKVAGTVSEWKDDPRKSKITVRHLLSFSSGLESPRRLWARKDIPDKLKWAIGLPAVAEPGTAFTYSEVHLYAFGEFFRRKLASGGDDPWKYLEKRVLKPIGLKVDRWVKEASGDPAMGDGAVLTACEWAKYGELMRRKGRWGDIPVLPEKLLAECFAGSPANPAYGLTFWLNKAGASGHADAPGFVRERSTDRISREGICPGRLPDLAMAAGAGQQRLYVVPSEKMVIVRFANEDMPRAVMRGEYQRMNLEFRDGEFFACLLGDPPKASGKL